MVTAQKICAPACSSLEMVLCDSNLVWQIVQALQETKTDVWAYSEWHTLTKVNQAFRNALADQSVALKVSKPISKPEEQALLGSLSNIVRLELQPHDTRVVSTILHPKFR
jgi:hypothetical protein